MLAIVAELRVGRMEEPVGNVGCRDAEIVTGIATDKVLGLMGQTPVGIQIANIQMPTPEQDEARHSSHRARLMRLGACSQTGTTEREGSTSCSNCSAAFWRSRMTWTTSEVKNAHNRVRMSADQLLLL